MLTGYVVLIQKWVKGWFLRRRFLAMRRAAMVFQKNYRRHRATRNWRIVSGTKTRGGELLLETNGAFISASTMEDWLGLFFYATSYFTGGYSMCQIFCPVVILLLLSDEARFQSAASHLASPQVDAGLQAAAAQDLRPPAVLSRPHHAEKVPSSLVQHHQAPEPLQEDLCQAQSPAVEDRKEEAGRGRETEERGRREAHEGEADEGGGGQTGGRATSPGEGQKGGSRGGAGEVGLSSFTGSSKNNVLYIFTVLNTQARKGFAVGLLAG